MCNFYRKFIQGFSDLAKQLNCQFRKDVSFELTASCQQAFKARKSAIRRALTLAHYDTKRPTVLTTDASLVALGDVLLQIQADGSEHPVAFASRTINNAERNYSAGEREALACIWAAEQFHFYLYGRRFTLRTDHFLLTTLLSGSFNGPKPMRLLRWADRLAQYSYNIEYHPGRQNVVTDYLSRFDEPIKASMVTNNADSDPDIISTISTIFGNPALHAITPAELAVDTEADDVLKRVLLCIQTG